MLEKKVSLKKKTQIVNLAEDLGMEDYPGILIEVWEDPSRFVVSTLLRSVLYTETMKDEDMPEFYEILSKFIVDSNIEGISFDTPEDVYEAFHSKDLPWGFAFELVVLLVARLLEKNENIKKALLAFSDRVNSGPDNASEEQE